MTNSPQRRAEMRIRTVLVTFRAAAATDPAQARGAAQRARALLDHVAVEIQPDLDDNLAAQLAEARREIEAMV
jgi:hypothetical protein